MVEQVTRLNYRSAIRKASLSLLTAIAAAGIAVSGVLAHHYNAEVTPSLAMLPGIKM